MPNGKYTQLTINKMDDAMKMSLFIKFFLVTILFSVLSELMNIIFGLKPIEASTIAIASFAIVWCDHEEYKRRH